MEKNEKVHKLGPGPGMFWVDISDTHKLMEEEHGS